MPLVPMNVDLDCRDAPPAFQPLTIELQLLHRCVCGDVHYTLSDWRTSFADALLAVFLLDNDILFLHGSPSLLFDHCLNLVVVGLEVNAIHEG